jgi:hypothetical protein
VSDHLQDFLFPLKEKMICALSGWNLKHMLSWQLKFANESSDLIVTS